MYYITYLVTEVGDTWAKFQKQRNNLATQTEQVWAWFLYFHSNHISIETYWEEFFEWKIKLQPKQHKTSHSEEKCVVMDVLF